MSPTPEAGASQEQAFLVEPAHPSFHGHFPGRPILPAVVLLAEVLARATAWSRTQPSDWSVSQAKFHQAVMPGDELVIRLGAEGVGIRFEVRRGQAALASGLLMRRQADAG